MVTRLALVLALSLSIVGCGDDVVIDVDLGTGNDASVGDSGLHDAGQRDMGTDSAVADSGPVADIIVAPESGLSTSEAGASSSFTVVLATQPTGNVVLEIASSDEGEATVSPTSLTFTTTNWDAPQVVTVVGVDDTESDGPQEIGVLVRVTDSSDPAYAAIEDKHVTGSNADNDTPGIMVTPTTGLVTSESGTTATSTIVLLTAPTANVSVAFTSSDVSEGIASPASVTFTPTNWSTPQTVTFTGVDDALDDGATNYIIATDPAVSTDIAYSGLNADDIQVTNLSDEAVPSVQSAYVKARNAEAFDSFGFTSALSADGNTLAVTAYGEDSNATGVGGDQSNNSAAGSGALFVYARMSGTWTLEAYIKASNTEAGDSFGYSVAISGDGDTIAVFANDEASNATGIDGNQADNSAAQTGAVYVFARSGTTWTQQAYVKPSNTEFNAVFGRSLALSHDGNRLAVGSPGENSNATGINGDQSNNSLYGAGAAYVFDRTGSTWAQTTYIKASNTGESDLFGTALAMSADGDVIAVGAWGEKSNATGVGGDQSNDSMGGAGAVYVFRFASSAWSQEAYIKASNTRASGSFGWAVALSGDGSTLGVGAPFESSNATGVGGDQTNTSMMMAGAVYVFSRSGGGWSQQSYVKASNTNANDYFGNFLAFSHNGNTMAVGAPHEASNATGVGGDQTNNSMTNAGAVYVFNRGGGTWAQNAYVKASNTDAGDNFGYRVTLAADGRTMAAGSYGEASNATTIGGDESDDSAEAAGALYVFDAL